MLLRQKVLCVCTNNYFRSQIAEHLIHVRYPNYEVRSAGTHSGYIGIPPSGLVMQALHRRGVADIMNRGYSATNITGSLVAWADVILCAEQEHADDISNTYKKHGELVVMGISDRGVSIPEIVEETASQIEEFLERWNSSTR